MHLAALSHERTNHTQRRLKAILEAQGHTWSRIDLQACDLFLGDKGAAIRSHGRTLRLPDVALTRRGAGIHDLEITVVNQLEHLGVKVLNGTHSLLVSRDKYWSLRRLADQGVPVPRTAILHDPKGIERAYDRIGEPPVVLKILRGMQGTGVMIAESRNSVRSILETFHEQGHRILLQEYISEAAGTDVRVFVIGGRAVAAMERRAPTGEFRSNIHRGGQGAPFKLDKEARGIAERAAKIMGLDIAGVDLLYADDGPKVMEINSSPGFEGLEKATGADIAGRIVDHAVAVHEGRAKPMALKARMRLATEA